MDACPPPAESAWAAPTSGTEQNAWDGATYTFNGNVDDFGNRYVYEGDTFAVESIVPLGSSEALRPSEYSVFYLVDNDKDGEIDGTDTVVAAADSIENRAGGMPKAENANGYLIVIVKGNLVNGAGEPVELTSGAAWSNYAGYGWTTHAQRFIVKEEKKSLEGAYAYETAATNVQGVTESELADKDFVYTGNDINFGIAVDGKALTSSDYDVTWIKAPTNSSGQTISKAWGVYKSNGAAGTYSAHLVGKGAYEGSSVDVEFTIDKLDLVTVSLAAADADKDNYGSTIYTANNFAVGTTHLASDAEVVVKALDYTAADGTSGASFADMSKAGVYRYLVSAVDKSQNVSGSQIVTVRVFDELTDEDSFKYGTTEINDPNIDGKYFAEFYLDRGQSFDPSMLNIAGSYEGFEYTVTKNGEKVDSFDEPGVYDVTMVQNPSVDYKTGGSAKGSFVVKSTYVDYSSAVVYAIVDGSVLGAEVEYDGQAIEPTVVAKLGNKVVNPSAYTVSYEKGGEPVDSIVDPADDYKIVVKFADGTEYSQTFKVAKAEIASAVATADFFALPYDGSAATPAFVGSTDEVFKEGNQFDLAAEDISVVYYKAKFDDKNTPDTSDDEWVKVSANTPAIAPEDLTEAGDYIADINLLSTCKTLTGSGIEVHVKVSEVAKFADVDANAWYAGAVYTAASEDFKYMTGLAGTKLFLPLASITRAEVAQVFYNMAGGDKNTVVVEDGEFSDVNKVDWYAVAVTWASQAGIVTGYDGTDAFGAADNATREQVATMIYRYMKAQGKDVSVEDEAAALAKYADGASVSDWAKTAMAYCIEAGVFGVDVDTLRPQDNLSRAEMAATSVRVQPEGAYTEL